MTDSAPTDSAPPISELRSDAALAYRLRPAAGAAPTACVLLLHGVGGSETDLAALAQALDAGWAVVLARAPLALGTGQYAWFPVRFGPQGPSIDAAQAEASRALLVRFAAEMQAALGVAPARTVIAGFSQGGIMSASVALTAPETVAGFGLLSGRILPEIEAQIAPAERLARLTGFVAHGRQDDTLPVAWAERADALLARLGVHHEMRTYGAGHALTPAMRADFQRWLRLVLPAPD